MVEVGDRVSVESEKVGSVTRSGVVTAVEDRLITVRWDSGSESVFVPSAGSLQVTGHEPPAGGGRQLLSLPDGGDGRPACGGRPADAQLDGTRTIPTTPHRRRWDRVRRLAGYTPTASMKRPDCQRA